MIDSKYKGVVFSDLYHKRWDIEGLYKISKVLFNINELHSKTERGIKQEIYAQFVLINIEKWYRFLGQDSSKIKDKFS